jgi:hypothetical protein
MENVLTPSEKRAEKQALEKAFAMATAERAKFFARNAGMRSRVDPLKDPI